MIIEIKELDKILKKLERLEELMLVNETSEKQPDFVTAEKAAEIFGTTKQTLYNHVKKGLFRKYKRGGRMVYYKLSELYAAFKPINI